MSTPTKEKVSLTKCQMCDREFKDSRGLGIHIVRKHKISKSHYYDIYLSDGISGCLTCGAHTRFYEITTGYAKFCSMECNNMNPELAKQRGTNQAATLAEDPSIMKKATAKFKQTLKANPEIKIDAVKKYKHTIRLPEVKARHSKNVSIARRDYYNRLNQSEGTMPCIIYLLAHSSSNTVKIGISSAFAKRLSAIQKDFGSVDIIKIVETTYDKAIELEIKMHKHFKSNCKVQPHGGGRTEFFADVITDEAIAILEEFELSV